MSAFLDLVRPLVDARLVMALCLVWAATEALLAGKIGEGTWGATVALTAWWATSGTAEREEARGLK